MKKLPYLLILRLVLYKNLVPLIVRGTINLHARFQINAEFIGMPDAAKVCTTDYDHLMTYI